jgi:hypothetical protein
MKMNNGITERTCPVGLAGGLDNYIRRLLLVKFISLNQSFMFQKNRLKQ